MKGTAVFCLATALAVSAHAAEGLRTLPDTAEAMGMAGGRLTLLDDASVVRTNPARLPEFADTTLTVSYQAWHGKTDFTGLAGQRDSMVDPWKHTGSVYLAHPVNDRLTAGLGVSAPFGISIKWPADGAFRFSGAHDALLQTVAINPAMGLKINDDVSLGLGLDIFRSRLRLEQRFPWGPALGLPLPDGNMVFDGNGWGVGGYAALHFDLGERHHLALVARLPVTVDYDGDFGISNIPAPGLAQRVSDFRSEIEHPGSIGVGYGFDVNEKLSLGFDFEWIENSTHDDVPLNVGVNQPLLAGNDAVPLNWEDSISIGAGAEYEVNESLILRAGYQYADSPMNARTYNPSVPADDRHTFSVGVGYSWGLHSVDFAYSLVHMGTTTIRGNVNPAFDGVFQHDWDILTISYTRRF